MKRVERHGSVRRRGVVLRSEERGGNSDRGELEGGSLDERRRTEKREVDARFDKAVESGRARKGKGTNAESPL